MSKIEWTDEVWNPVTGCTKVSPGCRNCYAERMAKRLAGRCGYPADDPFRVRLHLDRLEQPLHWRKPRRVFVCSMGDLFHKNVPTHYIDSVLDVIAACPQHTFIVLTKRPHLIGAKLYDVSDETPIRALGGGDYLPNLWLGVSVEDQATADERIPHLLDTLAAVRFVSAEPLLGEVEIRGQLESCHDCDRCVGGRPDQCYTAYRLSALHPDGIHWLIIGGESGPGARPCDVQWIRDLLRQARAARVPVFVKQLGANATETCTVSGNGLRDLGWEDLGGERWRRRIPLTDPKGGDPAEWPLDLRVREWPR